MDKTLNRQIIINEAIAGILFGIFGAIPVINVIALFSLFTLTNIFALRYYLVRNSEKLELKDSAILSAIGGFIAAFCACIVFIPVSLIFNVYGFYDLLNGVNILVLIFLSFFFSIICAMTNAFVGSILVYVYNAFKK